MTNGTWQVEKFCVCGTRLVVEHSLTLTLRGTAAIEGCYLLSRKNQLPGSAICSGCAKRHKFDDTWKEISACRDCKRPLTAETKDDRDILRCKTCAPFEAIHKHFSGFA
jgi:hypothetical protein